MLRTLHKTLQRKRTNQELATLTHMPLGWAYSVTGDQKYADWGNDIYDSIFSFAEDMVSDYVAGSDPKGYNMHYRAGGRYLAWRYGVNPPPPSPTPTPTPTPTPSPSPSPTPTVTGR